MRAVNFNVHDCRGVSRRPQFRLLSQMAIGGVSGWSPLPLLQRRQARSSLTRPNACTLPRVGYYIGGDKVAVLCGRQTAARPRDPVDFPVLRFREATVSPFELPRK